MEGEPRKIKIFHKYSFSNNNAFRLLVLIIFTIASFDKFFLVLTMSFGLSFNNFLISSILYALTFLGLRLSIIY